MEAPEDSTILEPLPLFDQGKSLYRQGKIEKALNCFQDAAKFLVDQPRDLVEVNLRISTVLLDVDRVEESVRIMDRTLEICQNNFEEDDPIVAKVYNSLSRTNRFKRKYELAYKQSLKALEINLKKLNPNDIEIGRNYQNIGNCLRLLNKYEDAIVSLNKALEIKEKYQGEDRDLELGLTYQTLGNCYHMTGEGEETGKCLETSLKLLQKYYNCNHPDINVLYDNLAGHYLDVDNIKKAHKYYQTLLESSILLHGEYHTRPARAYKGLGELYYKAENYKAAEENLLKALNIFKKLFGEDYLDVATTYTTLAEVRFSQKKIH